MNDTGIYAIQLRGKVSEGEVNAQSPLRLTAEAVPSGPALQSAQHGMSCFSVRTDQAGVVGLLRHLHGLGFIFASVTRADEP